MTPPRDQPAEASDGGAPVEWISRAEAIAQVLRDQIIGGQLRAGDYLGTKNELRERYSVAAGTVNQAVRLLETRGLVVTKPGPRGGLFVASPSVSVRLGHLILGLGEQALTLADALEIRNSLEVPLAVRAARNVRPADARELERLVTAMGECEDRPAEYLRRNWELHAAIARLSDNELLRTIYSTLLETAREALTDVATTDDEPGWWRANWQLHVDLVEAIVSGDPRRAARAAEAHTPLSTLFETPGDGQTSAGEQELSLA